jgi:hypothetical protein
MQASRLKPCILVLGTTINVIKFQASHYLHGNKDVSVDVRKKDI